jgi:hypothetical protein
VNPNEIVQEMDRLTLLMAERAVELRATFELFRAILDESMPAGHILDIPYLSQWDVPDADDRPGDCGPACVAMIAHFKTDQRPTVDEVATSAGQPTAGWGRWSTKASQLMQGGLRHGVSLVYRRPLDLDRIKEEIENGDPVIALVHYDIIAKTGENQDDFDGAHWVLVVGYDDESIVMHDPDFWGERRNEGAFRHVPIDIFTEALETPAGGNRYGNQGLIVLS